eukprot:SAG11_NODE_14551_length_608_cov_0.917485_1_plen_138_part_10
MTHFYFPSVAVPLPDGEAALHVTLCDDSPTCSSRESRGEVWRSRGGAVSASFTTMVGNNGGSWLGRPVILQHWKNEPAGLRLVRNSTVVLNGTPPQFIGACAPSGPQQRCGLTQGGMIVQDSDGALVAAFTGFASDGP